MRNKIKTNYHDFFEYLNEKGLSLNTQKSYKSDLNQLIQWCNQNDEIVIRSIEQYAKFLGQSSYKKSTIQRKIITLNLFGQFLLNQGYISHFKAIKLGLKKTRTLPKALTKSEILLLLSSLYRKLYN